MCVGLYYKFSLIKKFIKHNLVITYVAIFVSKFFPEFLNPTWWSTRPKAQFPSFDRVTRSPGSILIFLKNQNDVVLVKKSQRVTTGSYQILTFSIVS